MTTHPDLEAYILGHHDDGEAVEAHIAGCDECMAEVGREARLELLLHAAGSEDAFAAVVAPLRARRWPLLAAAGLAVAAALLVFAVWPKAAPPQRRTSDGRTSAPVAVPRGQPTTRPAWAADIEPDTARCSASGGDLTCAAASRYLTSRDQGEGEAADIASEGLLEVALLRGGPAVRAQHALYSAARSAALRSPDREATSRTRHAVASRAQLGHREGWYWEEFEKRDGQGTEFLVFVRFLASKEEIAALLADYKTATVDGAEIVPIVPGIRWALDPGDDLAWFVHRPGALAKLGIRAGDVLLHDQRRRLIDLPSMIRRQQIRIWRDGSFR